MKVNFKTIFSVMLLLVMAYSAAEGTLPDGPYFGQTPPGLTAQVFGPNIISLSNRRETKIVFSPDGQECLISAGSGLLYTKQQDGHWSDLTTPSFTGGRTVGEPFFSPDGQRIFFSSVADADLYVSTRTNQTWTTPQKLPAPVSTGDEEWHPTVTSDGTLYFCSSRNNPAGYYNIYRSRLVSGQYTQVERLNSTINSQYGAWDPYISPDENYLIFSTERPDGFGNVDAHISYIDGDGNWTNPENLGSAINTNEIEYGSYISYDGKYYFFSRPAGWGPTIPADIYWIDARAIFPDFDFTRDGKVNFKDLKILAAYWLTDEPSIDIAPQEPDGIVNFRDFAVFAQHWLEVLY